MVKITISGLPGSGKTTVAKTISKIFNCKKISIGDLRGEIAKEKGITIDELNEIGKTEDWVHKRADERTIEIGKKEGNFLVEGWLAYHFIPYSFKIFLKVDDKIAAKRIFKDQREDEKKCKTVSEVRSMLKKRLNITRNQFLKYYGVNFLDKKNYNLIIDTSKLAPEEVIRIILTSLNNLKNFKHNSSFFKRMYDIFSKKETLKKDVGPKEIVEVDFREKNSLLPSELIKNGLSIEFKELKVADYIVKGVAIERKASKDFFSSIFDKRIFSQMEELTQYEQKILIIEGNIKEERRIHENALRGILLSISIKYGVPIIFSKDEEETAKYISLIAKKQKSAPQIKATKKGLSPDEELLFILESFPGIGPSKAKKLLNKFKTLKKVLTSPEKQLKPILGKNSGGFKEIVGRKYYQK